MIVIADQSTVYNLFMQKYSGLDPPDGIDMYKYWIGRDKIIVSVVARKQGSDDPTSSWSQARYAWSTTAGSLH